MLGSLFNVMQTPLVGAPPSFGQARPQIFEHKKQGSLLDLMLLLNPSIFIPLTHTVSFITSSEHVWRPKCS